LVFLLDLIVGLPATPRTRRLHGESYGCRHLIIIP